MGPSCKQGLFVAILAALYADTIPFTTDDTMCPIPYQYHKIIIIHHCRNSRRHRMTSKKPVLGKFLLMTIDGESTSAAHCEICNAPLATFNEDDMRVDHMEKLVERAF
jgi:hypothetical protein